jgi:hypothetical protein
MSAARVLAIILQKNAAEHDGYDGDPLTNAGAVLGGAVIGGNAGAKAVKPVVGAVDRSLRAGHLVDPINTRFKSPGFARSDAGAKAEAIRQTVPKLRASNAELRAGKGPRAAAAQILMMTGIMSGATLGAGISKDTVGGVANVIGDSAAREVDRKGNNPLIQGAASLMDKGEAAGKAVVDRVADPFGGSLGDDPNSRPIVPPAKPGMLDTYWKNLKAGDPTTMIGTGAAALLAAVLTHNLLKKRSKR